jgi:hypothetical protein
MVGYGRKKNRDMVGGRVLEKKMKMEGSGKNSHKKEIMGGKLML